jgi:hypothetical protein
VPALPQSAIDEYGLTLYEEPPANSAPPKKATLAAFLADDRYLRDLRKQFAGVQIWKLALVSKPKKEEGVTEGWLKKKASTGRLGGAWQKRFFRLTTTRLAYWNTAEAAAAALTDAAKNPPKGSFPVSGFHEAVTTAAKTTVVPNGSSAPAPPAAAEGSSSGSSASSPRGRVARQASVLNTNLDSTRVRLGPWGSFIFILEFPGRSLELQASGKEDFSRWIAAFFGKSYSSKLAAGHEEDDKPSILASSGAKSSTVVATTLPLAGTQWEAIPIESRIGAPGAGGKGSREHSLSARDVLKGDSGLWSDAAHTGFGAQPREDIDSEESMSQTYEDRAGADRTEEWTTPAGQMSRDARRDSNRVAGGNGLNSFMPSASVTPASSVLRADADENPVENIIFQAEPEDNGTGQTVAALNTADDSDMPPTEQRAPYGSPFSGTHGTPSEDDDVPPVPAPFPVGLATPLSPVSGVEPEKLNSLVVQDATVSSPVQRNAQSFQQPAIAIEPQPSPVRGSGMFAGGLGAGGAGAVAYQGSLSGSTTVASAALASPASPHARRESLGISPMAQRRPSMDFSLQGQPPVPQPAPGSQLNFSPTLQRRMSFDASTMGPISPPAPSEPAPVPSSAEIAAAEARLAAQAEAQRAKVAEEEASRRARGASSAGDSSSSVAKSPEEQAEADARAEAQRRNLDNIRRYLEQEALEELEKKQAEEARRASEAAEQAPAPPPFPSSPLVSPTHGGVASPEEDAQIQEQHRRELEEFRASVTSKPQGELVDVATKQQKEIQQLRRQLALLQSKQAQQVSR